MGTVLLPGCGRTSPSPGRAPADEDACCGSPAGTRAAAALAPARGGASSPERAEGEEPLTPPPVREAPGGGRREGEGAGLLEKGAEDSSGDAAGG